MDLMKSLNKDEDYLNKKTPNTPYSKVTDSAKDIAIKMGIANKDKKKIFLPEH